MAKDLNKVMLIGRLGKDPEMKVLPSGSALTTFSLATSRSVRSEAGTSDQTEWFRITAWDKLAEICGEYLHKGSRIYIEGRLQSRKFTDKENIERTIVEVVATDMIMLDSKKQDTSSGDDWGNNNAPASSGNRRPGSRDTEDFGDAEDIPF